MGRNCQLRSDQSLALRIFLVCVHRERERERIVFNSPPMIETRYIYYFNESQTKLIVYVLEWEPVCFDTVQ